MAEALLETPSPKNGSRGGSRDLSMTPTPLPLGRLVAEETPEKLQDPESLQTKPQEILYREAPDLPTVVATACKPASSDTVQPPPGLELFSRSLAAALEPPVAAEDAMVAANAKTKRATPERLCNMLKECLDCEDVLMNKDTDGYIPIAKVFRARPELQRECYGAAKEIAKAVEASANSTILLDKAKRRVRLASLQELVWSEAEALLRHGNAAAATTNGGEGNKNGSSRAGGVRSGEELWVPISKLLASECLEAAGLSKRVDPAGFVRTALLHEESPAALRNGSWIVRRPRAPFLRKVAEELLSDLHLAQDPRLRSKIHEGNGEVPLTWLCSRYAEHFQDAFAKPTAVNGWGAKAQSMEFSAQDLCEALRPSNTLRVDARKLTVARRTAAAPSVSPSLPVSGTASAVAPKAPAGPVAGTRAMGQLRQLLDYYFEPFTLQNNRYLLDLLARRVGRPSEKGPWVVEELSRFSCSLEELSGLGRIASALAKLGVVPACTGALAREGLADLKHLQPRPDGQLQLRAPPELRSFVAAPGAPSTSFDAAVRYLAAAREMRGQAPTGIISVLSYAVSELVGQPLPGAGGPPSSQEMEQRRGKLKRQLMVHHADIVCLQGLDTESASSESITATLKEEGYQYSCARSGGEANSIFWDRSRWELVETKEAGAALGVVLRPFEDPKASVRVVCLRAEVQWALEADERLRQVFGGTVPDSAGSGDGLPLVVGADLTRLGGAEGVAVLEELAGLPSVALQVLGEELATPVAGYKEGIKQSLPAQCHASGLNRLRQPDAVLYGGMAPVAVLSGHTEGYLAAMRLADVVQQFPAFRLPLVAAFDWRQRCDVEARVKPVVKEKKIYRI
eukprot:TRINITY_DN15122_c0_g1_i1.p1 TRINITY_DN15122_c0_g1~~TRINITY_DN15122_c0_g1_i1.p1  ORF type:complete len:853 (-),score=189.00 TRINITY_DN15122_c0_g1_i1:121-2679(-)